MIVVIGGFIDPWSNTNLCKQAQPILCFAKTRVALGLYWDHKKHVYTRA